MSSNNAEQVPAGTTVQLKLDDMTLDELVQLSQGFGHQIEQLRVKRAYLKAKIDARLAMLERTGDTDRLAGARRRAEAAAAGSRRPVGSDPVDGAAPGAVIDAGVSQQ